MRRWRKPYRVLSAIAILVIAGGATLSYLVELIDVPPRALAPYIERRVSQHNPIIVGTGTLLARTLMFLDRGENPVPMTAALRFDIPTAQAANDSQYPDRMNTLVVDTMERALKAIGAARPGQTIVFAPGTYRFRGASVPVTKPGTRKHRILVRAERPGTVILELEAREGFLVTAPYWSFENLVIRGVCKLHSHCDHAFHVVGNAHHFIARNNVIVDFNAHFKINGLSGKMPDHGIIEGNTLTNTSIRATEHAVTLIDLVAASGWQIRHNVITDFIKGGSNRISYGAFVKGGGAENRLEQNIVICENQLKGAPGQRVGLSLGGGGTGKPYCRDQRCITEQDRSVIASNLIASCSDDGIYVNRSASSRIFHNTVIDTGGIVVRFPESSADVEGNLVDGSIRVRDEGVLRSVDNFDTSLTSIFWGRHPVRNLYADGALSSFEWNGTPPRRMTVSTPTLDLCRATRPQFPVYGAFEDFSDCLKLASRP